MMQALAIGVSGGFLDLGNAPNMSLYYRNAFFDFEVRAGNKSLPLDVPPTPHNKKLLGFYNRADTEIPGEFDSTLWLFGNSYRKGRLKVSFEGGNFKCTFFWGLASKARHLKGFKLSQLDHVFDYSELGQGPSGNRFARAELYYNNLGASANSGRRYGDATFSVFDNPVFTLRIKRNIDGALTVHEERLNTDNDSVTGAMEDLFGRFAVFITQNVRGMNAIQVTDDGIGIRLVWFWPPNDPHVSMEVLEITTTSKADSKIFTAFFYNSTLLAQQDKYPELSFPEFFANDLPLKDEYLNSMAELPSGQGRFMLFNKSHLVPFVRLDFILIKIAESIGFNIIGIENVGPVTFFTAQILNFQYSFTLGDILPDITANVFLKNAAVLYGLNLDFDEELNTLLIGKKKTIINGDANADYTDKVYHYQDYHDKVPNDGSGFEFKIGGFSYVEEDGSYKIGADFSTLTESDAPIAAELIETGETVTRVIEVLDQQGNVSTITIEVPIVIAVPLSLTYYGEEMYMYGWSEGNGRIDGVVLVDIDENDNKKALALQPLSVYLENYQELVQLRTQRAQLILPAIFDVTDVYSVDENKPFLVDNQKFMPTEFRLQIGSSLPVAGEIYCRRIL